MATLNVVFDYLASKDKDDSPNNDTPEAPDQLPIPDPMPAPTPDPTPAPTPQPDEEVPEAIEKTNSTVVAVEFTGQMCPYCHHAIEGLERVQQSFGSNLIVVAMHSYHYAKDKSFFTDHSLTYSRHVNLSGYPSVYLNLNKYKNSYNEEAIKREIEIKSQMKSTLKAEINGNNIDIRFRSDLNDGMKTSDAKYNVLLWITENDIIGYQAEKGWDYNHQHVFRGHLNGVWGETYIPGTTYTKTATIPYQYMKIQNCEVIAIVTDSVTHKFIDAVKVDLKN